MGCGSVKTSEGSEKYDSYINQSGLLPVVKVNQRSKYEESNILPNSNINNISSLNKNEISNSKINPESKKSQKTLKTQKILEPKNLESKKIENNIESKSEPCQNLFKEKIENLKQEKEQENNNNIIIINNDDNNNSINYVDYINNDGDSNSIKKINNIKTIRDNDNNINNIDAINNSKNNYNEQEKNILEKEENKNGNSLKGKANTTDKIPHYKSKTILSSIQDEFPKDLQNSIISDSFLDKKYLEIDLQANIYEKIFPIWVSRDEEIEFIVQGKWKINKNLECDSKGIPNNELIKEENNKNQNKYNDGALIGRVLNGQPFMIYNGLKYISEISGPLILKMNLNSVWSKEKPRGSLKLKIYGVRRIENAEDLEEKIGWWKQLRIINFINKEHLPNYNVSNFEKSIIVLFNKLRHDSKLFTSQYLDNYQRLTPTTKKIYEQFMTNKDQFIPLKINLSIIKLLQNFYNKFIDEKNKNKEEDWIYILKSENYLQKYLEQSFYSKKNLNISILRYYDDNPFYLGLRILFRDNIRNNILNYCYEEISMIILKDNNDRKNVQYCIIVLSNKNGNDKINYEVDMNIEKYIENDKNNNINQSIFKNIKKN